MKCLHCLREIKSGQTSCPHCRKRVLPNSYSTITDATETLEQNSRRRLLQQVIQFSLVAITFIALASFVRFDPPKANPLPPESLRTSANNSPVSAPTPEPVIPSNRTVVSAAVTPVPKTNSSALQGSGQPLSLLTAEDFRVMNKVAVPVRVSRDSLSVPPTAPAKPRVAAAASTDEAAPKKLATPIAPSIVTAPRPSVTANPEAELKLEVESAGVLLHPNTGLVTIKSYVPARIYIDGVYSGSTPRSVKLLAGEHTINLLAEGYHEYSRKVKVSGQQQVGILASMSKK